MPDVTLEEVFPPRSLRCTGDVAGDRAVADFAAYVALTNSTEAEVLGSRELDWAPEELIDDWHDPYAPRRLVLAYSEGRVVGACTFEMPIFDGATECWLSIDVDPEFRRRGIGSALWDRGLELVQTSGYSVVQSWVIAPLGPSAEQPGEPIALLPARTGIGAVPLEHPATRFALAHGGELEQVERFSRLPLPVDPAVLARHLQDASAYSSTEYRVVSWAGRTPDGWTTDMALLRTSIPAEYPNAELATSADPWDDARIRARDDKKNTQPGTQLVVAAEHVASCTLVGFSELWVPDVLTRPVSQEDTLVHRDHRGHRLGMLLKAANLSVLAELYPGHPSVVTYNAEENRPMLSVNEAIGFVAIAYEGAWQRAL